jgi:hypothetical protein
MTSSAPTGILPDGRGQLRPGVRATGEAHDQFGQVIDVLASEKRDLAATRRFFTRALEHGPRPSEVTTDRAPAYPRVLDELLPAACHVMEQHATIPSSPIMDDSKQD